MSPRAEGGEPVPGGAGVGAAEAHSNIAFSKYWGKRPYPGNYPATPSLSMTLDALTTRTRVTFRTGLSADHLVLGGKEQIGRPLARASELLDRLRARAATRLFAEVVSASDFPVASGLASSASGFAALALAGTHALGLPLDLAEVSDLARRSSASAARSVFGGFVELPAGNLRESASPLPAAVVAGPDHVDWRLVVAVAGEAEKAASSTSGMERTRAESPYYDRWLELAPVLHAEIKAGLLAKDLPRFGRAAEESALAMHASALAAGVVYLGATSLALLDRVRALRDAGTLAFATMDAGPHVKVLCHARDVDAVRTIAATAPGVTRVTVARPASGARTIAAEEVPE